MKRGGRKSNNRHNIGHDSSTEGVPPHGLRKNRDTERGCVRHAGPGATGSSLTLSFTHSLTHSITPSLPHSLTHSLMASQHNHAMMKLEVGDVFRECHYDLS